MEIFQKNNKIIYKVYNKIYYYLKIKKNVKKLL
jgi:hypothetical protein